MDFPHDWKQEGLGHLENKFNETMYLMGLKILPRAVKKSSYTNDIDKHIEAREGDYSRAKRRFLSIMGSKESYDSFEVYDLLLASGRLTRPDGTKVSRHSVFRWFDCYKVAKGQEPVEVEKQGKHKKSVVSMMRYRNDASVDDNPELHLNLSGPNTSYLFSSY